MSLTFPLDRYGEMFSSERVSAEGQPMTEARCSGNSSLVSAWDFDAMLDECFPVLREKAKVGVVEEVEGSGDVGSSRKRTRRGGRGRGGKPRSVSPAQSITSLCTGVYRAVLGDEDYVAPLDKLAVVLDEKKEGYSYVDLLRPSVVTEAVRMLGPRPTLRRLLRLGPGMFKPVDTLNQIYVYIGQVEGRVVSSPTSDGAYAKFWAVVRSLPEFEMSRAWMQVIMRGGWRRCFVPCVSHPGYCIN